MTLFEDWPLDLLTLSSSLPFKKLGVGNIDLFIMFWNSQVGKFLFLKDIYTKYSTKTEILFILLQFQMTVFYMNIV